MKGSAVLSVAIFLTISSAFAQSLSIDPDVGRLQLSSLLQHSVGKILSEFGQSAIAKRQTVYDITTQDVVDCVSRTIEYQCGSSGYSQKVVDIATGCKNDSYARNTANTCARNEKGETCGAVALKFLSGQTNAESCLGSLTNEFGCNSECHNFLQSAKDSLGCCLNAYVNRTDYPLFEEYREHVDYRLWDLCEIDLPDAECKDSRIKFESLNDVKSCTSQEILTKFVRYECSADVGQSLVNNLMKNDRCYIFSSIMVDACSSNGNGQYCAESIGTDLMTNFVTDSYVIALNSHCGAHDPDSGCSSACKDSINAIKKAYGCCVNVYNDSSIGLQLGALSYSVWNECGIESPGFCQTTQTIPTKPPTVPSETVSENIPVSTDSTPEITTESAPVTQRAPIVSSERPDVEVIVVTGNIPEPDEDTVSTEEPEIIEETESMEPREPTDSTPLEEVETTQPEENEPNNGEEEIMETAAPSEPTIDEDGMETTAPSEPTSNEDVETTAPSEPTINEDVETAAPSEPTVDEEDLETTAPSEPTIDEEGMETTVPSEPTVDEDVETTAPSEPTVDEEDVETTAPSEPTVDEEDLETTAPSEPTVDEEDQETTAPSEPTVDEEDQETTAPSEPTVDEEDVETTAPSEPTVDEEDLETTAPSEPTVDEEDQETTAPSEPTVDEEDQETTAPSEPTVDEEDQETTAPSEPTVDEEDQETTAPSEPTVDEEDLETTAPSEPTIDENVETTAPSVSRDQSASESIQTTEAIESTHPTDHSTVSSEAIENVEVVQTTKSEDSDAGVSAQTESGGPPSVDSLGVSRFNGSVPSARALFSAIIVISVAVTIFIQQL